VGIAAGAAVAWWAVVAQGQGMPRNPGAAGGVEAPIRITMEELHAQGGVPRGWKFSVPPGDVAAGRRIFAAMECFACHEVKGEDFPHPKRARGSGPELTSMGSHHPAEYFAESILHPNRVIVTGPGYTGADGLSKMPSYAGTMTLEQLVDVVSYLGSLTGGQSNHRHGHHRH
jgi:mono/diheme cytochrome c family protein